FLAIWSGSVIWSDDPLDGAPAVGAATCLSRRSTRALNVASSDLRRRSLSASDFTAILFRSSSGCHLPPDQLSLNSSAIPGLGYGHVEWRQPVRVPGLRAVLGHSE